MQPFFSARTLRYSVKPRAAGRAFFLWAIGSLIALAWLTLWIWDRSPYGRYLKHDQLGDFGLEGFGSAALAATLYITGWALMTVAMMLPTVVPLLEIFRRLTLHRRDRARLLLSVIIGYLSIWAAFGVAAHLADWLLHEVVERVVWLDTRPWVIGAATLFVAGAFQFSALKYRCLDKCRAPLSFVMEHWRGRHDLWNALRLGINHGKFCLGCCWALMLLMFGVGVGNIGWMLALAALMAIEKTAPWGRKIAAPLGIGLLGWAAVIALYQMGQ
jgi:predicted metal-binding membrane protein